MRLSTKRISATPATRVLIRLLVYYVLLIGGTALAWRNFPHSGAFAPASLDALFGGGPPAPTKNAPEATLDEVSLSISVSVAMLAAVLLSLPVAWVYQLTRAKRGYQQSVVQLLIILPVVVAGIVLLVKYSIALAFSLAGIVAAVRFRNTLDDSKDAVYVFLATAVGLSSAVNLPVAAVVSVFFNVVILVLWYADFGSAATELDGRIAEKRLQRARELARTGTFVARIDEEVFRNMTPEQLEGVAQRALKRAASKNADSGSFSTDIRLRVVTSDAIKLRDKIEPQLQANTKSWRFSTITFEEGLQTVEYYVQLKKRSTVDDLLMVVRVAGEQLVQNVEVI